MYPFFIASSLLCAVSAVVTVTWCTSMSRMGTMQMPGNWTMSMAWMRMPGQTWPGTAASFLAMWTVMMVAMMLPSLVPMLWRCRQAFAVAGEARPGVPTTLVGAGYFFVWTAFGVAVFPLGVTVAAIAMQQPAFAHVVPIAAGALVVIAGALQFTGWKTRQLACCHQASTQRRAASDPGSAWRLGVRLGLECSSCCMNLMVILLVAGAMDLRVMVAVTAAITSERLAPAGDRVVQAVGVVGLAAGVFLIAHAIASG